MNYLLKALELAQQRRGFCAPNPAVGAVVVKDGQIVGAGTHWAAGEAHAEVVALQQAGQAAKDATIYVTLEPCSHYGRTPPCVEAIIKAGIKKVIFGFADPNTVASHGQRKLQDAGIDCELSPLPEIQQFYHSYAYWLKHQKPWVTLKLALSADNKIAGENGRPVQITGEACQQYTQEQRCRADALLTTAETVLNDNPRMNARFDKETIAKPVFVLDRSSRLDGSAQLFKTAKSVTLYHDEAGSPRDRLNSVAVQANNLELDLEWVLADIGRRGVQDLWVEVGAKAFHAFYQKSLVNTFIFYRSKKSLGENALPAFHGIDPLQDLDCKWQVLGDDEIAICDR